MRTARTGSPRRLLFWDLLWQSCDSLDKEGKE